MRPILMFAAMSALCLGTSHAEEKAMDVPLAIRSLRVAPDGRISLEMWNVSDKPVRLWRDSNTWGAARWRVLRVRAGELRVAHQRIVEGFTVNLPVFDELAPQARLEVTLDLSQPRWSGTIDAHPAIP